MKYNEYLYSNWETREQTRDENEIGNYLLQNYQSELSKHPYILHVGIGSNKLYNQLKSEYLCYYTGLTYTILEYEQVLPLLGCSYKPILINKYNPILSDILKTYDFIIDNNIASYADSDTDALNYFKTILHSLKPNGKLLTHQLGLDYRRPVKVDDMLKELELEKEFSVKSSNGVVIIQKI